MMSVIGKYFIFLGSLFGKGEKLSVYWRRFMEESVGIGVSSIFIVAIVSTFIGAVSCIQTAYNLVSPIIPVSTVALIVRDMQILELAPTITCIVLAGKVGSNIASELGTMRITEQIDALEVMGINSSSYLVLPKVLAAMFTFPMLVILAAFLGIFGGYLAGTLTGVISERDYLYGIRDSFVPYNSDS
jgi:phospholipid/cholesterol/gamma-HCH transport system permease protein